MNVDKHWVVIDIGLMKMIVTYIIYLCKEYLSSSDHNLPYQMFFFIFLSSID